MQIERLESTKKFFDQKIKEMSLGKKPYLKKEEDKTITSEDNHTLGYYRGYEDAANEIYCMLIGEKFSYKLGKEEIINGSS